MHNEITSDFTFPFTLVGGTIGDKHMPTTLNYLLTCGRFIYDQITQSETYQDVFSQIFIPIDSQSVIQGFWVVGKLYLSTGGTINGNIRFTYPDTTESDPLPISGIVQPGIVMLKAYFPPIKFTQIGTYFLRVKIGDQELETNNYFYFEVVKRT